MTNIRAKTSTQDPTAKLHVKILFYLVDNIKINLQKMKYGVY